MLNILLYLIFLSLLYDVETKNILAAFPIPSRSPNHMCTAFIKELAERGHQVTIVTANLALKDLATENITTIDIYGKLNRIWVKYNNIIASNQNPDVISEVTLTLNATNYLFEEMLQIDEVQNLIIEKHSYFDLLILEASMMPLLSFSHIFKAPVVLVSSISAVLGNYNIAGEQNHPFLYPSVFQRRIYNLTNWEKLTETSTYIRLKLKMLSSDKKLQLMLQKNFGTDFPSVDELKRNVFALFLNSNPIWAGSQPVSSNVVFMGGIQSNKMEELSEDLQSFLDKSRKGVIYVSFGTNIKPTQMPPKQLLRILNALSEISYDVLLKWDNDRLSGVPKTVKTYKWLPQSSILAHPKIKLFITQGGIQSTFEAINAGVPLIGIPIYSDQWYNTEKYTNFHIGAQIDLASLTEEKLIDAIHLVMRDQSFHTSVSQLREVMYERPGTSMDRALWWTEQILQPYGVRYLRAPAANISWAEYLELDFIFSLLLIIFVTMVVLIVLITLITRYIFKSIKDIKKKMR